MRRDCPTRRETFACLVWAVLVGLAAFGLLLAVTACDPDPLPDPEPDPGLVCTTYGGDPPMVECQRFPAPFPGPGQ